MTDPRTLVEKEMERAGSPSYSFDDLIHRRDRERRNQRIAAGVVGMAVFVALVLIVGTVDLSDRTQGPAGGVETGPAETGPAETGPAETGPAETGSAKTGSEGREVVAQFAQIYPVGFVYVYADGRVIYFGHPLGADTGTVLERRLTPQGVDLVRSGALQAEDLLGPVNEVPASAWADREVRPYVPSRYAVCYFVESGEANPDNAGYEYPSTVLGFFPAPARAILRGELTRGEVGDPDSATPECSEVTTDEKRALEEILSHVVVEDPEGDQIFWETDLVLPHGVRATCLSCS